MKIIHFVSGLNSGGVEQMLTNYTQYLNKDSNIEEYIIYQHNPNQVSLNKLISSGNTCIRIHSKMLHPLKNFIDTYKIVKRINPDIVHSHMNLLNFIPLFIAFICRIKVRISHSHIAHININSKIAEHFFKIFNIMFANVLVACGQKAGKYMYRRHKFFIIPNCVDINQFIFDNVARSKIREKYNVKKNTILLGNVGRFTDQKNQLFLLNLLKELSQINDKYLLIIIGSGENKSKIIQRINEYKLNNKVILHSPVNNISDYYDAMDIFLLPSLYEGFPVSAVESQIAGLRTIMSDSIDHMSKLNNNTKYININNDDQWINSIINFKNKSRHINKKDFCKFDIIYGYHKLKELYENVI